MPRSKSSRRWLQEHFSDPYVKKAQKEGYRARSAFKLKEILERTPLIRKGMSLVDLGAAPGAWSQILAEQAGQQGRVFALDILAMKPLTGVDCIQGDFTDPNVYDELSQRVGAAQPQSQEAKRRVIDGVFSDLSPNMSGNLSVDQTRSMYLSELALHFAKETLKEGGFWVCKIFQGEGSDALLKELRLFFRQVQVRKPDASRLRSREVYWVGKGFKVSEAERYLQQIA